MRAVRLELFNFCQHRHVVHDFGPGLTAVLGPNGSGKSNFIGAMKFALTGEIPSAGKKETNICQLASETESSFVSFRFQHGGFDATVKRWLRPARPSELTIVGADPISQDRRINTRIEELLCERSIIDDIVMVNQGDIFGFLSQKPAKRAEAFAKIFRTARAETCWKALGDHIRSRPVSVTAVDCEVLRTQIITLDNRRRELLVITGEHSVEELQQQFQTASNTAQRYTQVSQYRTQAQQVNQQVESLNGTIGTLEAHIAENEENVGTLREAAAGSEAAAEQAKVALANLDHITAINKQKENLRQRIVGNEEMLVDPPEGPEGHDKTTLLQRDAEISALSATINKQQDLLDSCDQHGVAECPTCHTPVDNLQDAISEANGKLPLERENLAKLQRAKLEHANYLDRLTRYHQVREQTEMMLKRDREALEGLETAPPMPSESPEALLQLVNEHSQYTSAIAQYDTVVNDGKAQLANLSGQVEQLIRRSTELGNQIGEIDVPPDEALEAQREAVRLRRLIDQVALANNELIQVDTSLAGQQARLADGEAAEQANENVRLWVERLGPVRDLLHREAAPRFVSQRNLQRIQIAVNEHLERFDTDFRVRADEGLSFVARFTDGKNIPAERLSGGQQVVLALAFRLAVNFMYSDLGFLSLDEPTAYLDAHHIAGFEPVLNRLREYATSRGLQCIMITHEQSLAHLFDSVVQL